MNSMQRWMSFSAVRSISFKAGNNALRRQPDTIRAVRRCKSFRSEVESAEVAVLSIDVGTTALKAALVLPSGELRGRISIAYANGTQSGEGGTVEQIPDDWTAALSEAANTLLTSHCSAIGLDIGAITLSGQMQDVIPVAEGSALRSALLYSDVRAKTESGLVLDVLGEDCVRGQLINYKGAASCLAKWLWLVNNDPRTMCKAESLLLGAHSYVAYCLTGEAATDATTASTTGLLSLQAPGSNHSPQWATEELGALSGVNSLDLELLPPLKSPGSPLGAVTPAAVRRLGLPPSLTGVPVFHGSGDVATTTIGATGPTCLGQPYLYLGTSGWIATCLKGAPGPDQEGVFQLLHPSPDIHIRAASMTTAGGNVEWARSAFLPSGSSLQDFDAVVAKTDRGAGGLIYMPHLQGERSPFTDPSARASFINISAATTPAHMARAVLEGVAFGYRSLVDTLDGAQSLSSVAAMPLVGGGAKSSIWTQILADVLGCAILPLPDADAVAARGSAAEAMPWLGAWPAGTPPSSFSPALADMHVQPGYNAGGKCAEKNIVMPDARAVEQYSHMYEVYRELYPAIQRTGAYDLAAYK